MTTTSQSAREMFQLKPKDTVEYWRVSFQEIDVISEAGDIYIYRHLGPSVDNRIKPKRR